MKRILVMLLLSAKIAMAGIWVTPAYVGNGTGDSTNGNLNIPRSVLDELRAARI